MHLHGNSLNLKFTGVMDHKRIEFLDVVLIGEGEHISSVLYRKPSAGNSPLRADSGHPRHTIKDIPVGQFLRLRRVCSDDSTFLKEASDLRARFMDRVYTVSVLDRAFNIACKTERKHILHDNVSGNRNGGKETS